MRKVNYLLLLLSLAIILPSCVGKKKFVKAISDKQQTQMALDEALERLRECQLQTGNLRTTIETRDRTIQKKDTEINRRDSEIASLKQQANVLENTNTQLLDQMANLSVVSKAGAESIQKSLESINRQSEYIQKLTSKIQAKDSTNLVLVMNLKRSLANINDRDVDIEVKGSVVYVSISDKLLFRSGSSSISSRAEEVLGKVASVINDHSNLDVIVEGHTDNVPIANSCVSDNWDLSTKRATAIVRVLQNKYAVDPSRLTAAGRSEFLPKVENDSSEGRSVNRRTEIILTPKLDEYFKLLEPPVEGQN